MRAVVRMLSLALLALAVVAFRTEPPPSPPASDDDAIDGAADDDDDDVGDDDDADDRDDDRASALTLANDGDEPAPKKKRTRRSKGGCPTGTARVGDICMDRYEAPNRRGGKPLVMQSAQDAEEWCAARKKRLCGEDEWIAACEGAQRLPYPYGDAHEDGRCNDDKVWRTVDETTLAKWPAAEAQAHTKELYQAAKSGTKKGCKSEVGVYDLTGNVEEWVVRTRDHANDYHHILIGCYWSGCYGGGKPTCKSTNAAHGPGFRFYETGFRCCADLKKRPAAQ